MLFPKTLSEDHIKISATRAGEVAQWVEYLLHKGEDLNLGPQNPHRS